MPRGRLGAENPFAPLDVVEVDLEDALFVQHRFEHEGEDELLSLARQVAFAGQQQVLGQLLRDRRAADHLRLAQRLGRAGRCRRSRRLLLQTFVELGDARLGFLVALPGLFERVPFDAAVLGEARVLGGDDGASQVRRYLGAIDPALAPADLVLLGQQAPDFRTLKTRRLRVDDGHQRDAQRENQLQGQRAQHQQGHEPQRGRGRALHRLAPVSASCAIPINRCCNAASTGAVSGRTRRQM